MHAGLTLVCSQGATTIVPFSHKMYDQYPRNDHPDKIQLSMKSGSCVFWESGLWY
jgi:ectoine hydroxylase-related dioxygenase (phytanoyl-CoA dioxygenase family)